MTVAGDGLRYALLIVGIRATLRVRSLMSRRRSLGPRVRKDDDVLPVPVPVCVCVSVSVSVSASVFVFVFVQLPAAGHVVRSGLIER